MELAQAECCVSSRGCYAYCMQVIRGTAQVHGCKAEVRWSEQAYGATVNDPEIVGLVEGVAEQLVGASRWQRLLEPTMAAEDFSFLAGAPRVSFGQLECCCIGRCGSADWALVW